MNGWYDRVVNPILYLDVGMKITIWLQFRNIEKAIEFFNWMVGKKEKSRTQALNYILRESFSVENIQIEWLFTLK